MKKIPVIIAIIAALFISCTDALAQSATSTGTNKITVNTPPNDLVAGPTAFTATGTIAVNSQGSGSVGVQATGTGAGSSPAFLSLTFSGTFSGTVDFSTNNPSVTLTGTGGFNDVATAAHTWNLGSGKWTVSQPSGTIWSVTSTTLTMNASSATVSFTGVSTSNRIIQFGTSKTIGTVSLSANASGGDTRFASSGDTFTNFSVGAPNNIQLVAAGTLTLTNPPTLTGTNSNLIYFFSSTQGTTTNMSSSSAMTCTWCIFRDLARTGTGSFTATNAFSLGDVSGITITPPASGGGGSCILGGWLLWRDLTPEQHDNLPAFLDQAA